jgi:hypothetical protein
MRQLDSMLYSLIWLFLKTFHLSTCLDDSLIVHLELNFPRQSSHFRPPTKLDRLARSDWLCRYRSSHRLSIVFSNFDMGQILSYQTLLDITVWQFFNCDNRRRIRSIISVTVLPILPSIMLIGYCTIALVI